MDDQIIDVIRNHFGDLRGLNTKYFYDEYVELCEKNGVKPRSKIDAIRKACDYCGIKTKQKHITYTVFCEVEP